MLALGATQAHSQTAAEVAPSEAMTQPFATPNAVPNAATTLGIGQWDGVTPSAHLSGAYEDTKQFNFPFGAISYYNSPWRGYMDTWPSSQYLHLLGAMWNLDNRYAEPVCQLLQESGIRSVRIEIGWGDIGWNDDLTPNKKAEIQALFGVFQKHGIRPLILLNANHGAPGPMRSIPITVAAPAKAGDKTIRLSEWSQVRPGYSGFANPQYVACLPFITSVDANGTAHLSTGLPYDVGAGVQTIQDLKYQPFQGTTLVGGASVPAATDTFNGWMKYAAAVGTAARDALGTVGKPDAGFDVEVWNELTFGSDFLDINNYYDTKFNFSQAYSYTKTRPQTGLRPGAQLTYSIQGAQSILPMTVDYFTPANGFPGVNVISGFSNQQPWESGSSMWPGEAGFSRHFYTGGWTDCSPTNQLAQQNWGPIDALGNIDGQLDGKDWGSIIPGTDFVPTFRCSFPEFWHTGLKTEAIARDVVPDSRESGMPGWAGVHGRYADNGDFHPAQVWESETNYSRGPFMQQVQQQAGVAWNDPRLLSLDAWTAGKMELRQYVFHAHKGLTRIMTYCLGADTYNFGMLPQSLLSALDQNGNTLNDAVRQQVPPGFKALTWINTTMSAGQSLAATCPLSVQDLVEYKPRLVLAGNGTAANPNKWNRDQFAFLPFQLSATQYTIPYYVVTQDVTHVWNPSADPLDPARYDMPDQDFDVTIGNIGGPGATVSAFDPLKGASVPVSIVAATPTTLTVRLKAGDYPRFLQVTEAKSGPLISQPLAVYAGHGQVKVTWRTNVPVKAVVTYGTDWTTRSAKTVTVPASSLLAGSVTIPGCQPGVTAVRIKVTSANGLTTTWPRWDQDPVGQVLVPTTP